MQPFATRGRGIATVPQFVGLGQQLTFGRRYEHRGKAAIIRGFRRQTGGHRVKSANRLLAIAFGAVWFFPAYRLLDLPHRRAVNLANVVREQLKSADQDPIPAQNLRPYYSLESPLPREDALRIVAHPEGYELAAWLAWVIEE